MKGVDLSICIRVLVCISSLSRLTTPPSSVLRRTTVGIRMGTLCEDLMDPTQMSYV